MYHLGKKNAVASHRQIVSFRVLPPFIVGDSQLAGLSDYECGRLVLVKVRVPAVELVPDFRQAPLPELHLSVMSAA